MHRHGNVTVAGNQYHRQLAVSLQQAVHQREPVHAGQADIADDNTGHHARLDFLQCQLGTGAAHYRDIFQQQCLLTAQQDVRVVLDKQYGQIIMHGECPPLHTGAR